MNSTRLLVASSLIAAFGTLMAQAPKDKPAAVRPKVTAKQVAEAEARLLQANCALHYEEIKPLVPNAPPGKGPVDIVAFPADTTDADLARLILFAMRLPNLKTVDLAHSTKVTAKGFKEIARLADLKAIYLDGCNIDADGLKELSALKDLQWLDLSRSSVRDGDLRVLADFPALQNLTLEQVQALTATGVANLQKIVRLRVLHISVEADPAAMTAEIGKLDMLVELRAYPVGNGEAKEIGNLRRLQVLDLNNGQVHWRAFRGKAEREAAKPDLEEMRRRIPDAEKLKLAMDRIAKRGALTGITSEGFPHLLNCADLRVLRLAGHPIDVKGSGLDKLEFLEELDLSGTEFTDDGVSWLGKLKALRKLWLSGTGVTNEGVKGLAVAGGLELVALDHLPLTDEAIGHLARNRRLKELSLNDTRVACADKSAWSNLVRLERVGLQKTNITDAALMNLAPLKTLRLVDATRNCPNVSLAGAAALERELPGARVVAQSCDIVYWPGGGGVPSANRGTREPDLGYRNPNPATRPSAKLTPNPPATTPKAPPPAIRTVPLPKSGKP
jgi:hypothetical protein